MVLPIGAVAKIAEYFGLIEGVNTKVTKLLHQAFNSAKSNLEYARNGLYREALQVELKG